MSDVEWREIPGFDGVYEASSEGVIRRKKPGKKGGPGVIGKVITAFVSNVGYLRVCLRSEDRDRTFIVHRLVAMAFLGAPPDAHLLTVNHKDGDKVNNRPTNLEWATRSENYRHALDTLGFQPPRGGDHWNAKLTPEIVVEMRCLRARGMSVPALADRFAISSGGVSLITRGLSWGHIEPKSYLDLRHQSS